MKLAIQKRGKWAACEGCWPIYTQPYSCLTGNIKT